MSPHALQCMEIWGGNAAVDELVSVPGLDARVLSSPHAEAASGGDIHYVSTCAAGIISRFVLADVAGHGAEADAAAVALRRLMRKHINTPDQSRLSRSLNEEFGRLTEAGRFATAVMATYFAPTDHLIVCNAGHPPPLRWRSDRRSWEVLLDGEGSEPERDLGISNLPLGIIEPTAYRQFAVPLHRGDIVLLYTDALLEASDLSGRQLGESGLLALLHSLKAESPFTIGPEILQALDRLRGGRPADDDTTILVLHHNGADPPGLSLKERLTVWGRMLGLPSLRPSAPAARKGPAAFASPRVPKRCRWCVD